MAGKLLWVVATSFLFIACSTTTPPFLVFQPAPNAQNVPLEGGLVFQFVQAMRADSVEQALEVAPPIICDWQWSDDKTMATCTPRFELLAGQAYALMFKSELITQAGQTVTWQQPWSFTTEDPRSPVRVEADPRVLSGGWTGQVRDYPTQGQETTMLLDLTATYLDDRRYEIRGRLTVGSLQINEFNGYALGLNAERYLTGLQRVTYAILEGTNANREGTWFLKCQRPTTGATYSCSFEAGGSVTYAVELHRRDGS